MPRYAVSVTYFATYLYQQGFHIAAVCCSRQSSVSVLCRRWQSHGQTRIQGIRRFDSETLIPFWPVGYTDDDAAAHPLAQRAAPECLPILYTLAYYTEGGDGREPRDGGGGAASMLLLLLPAAVAAAAGCCCSCSCCRCCCRTTGT